jgi:hypothetical protein
MSAHVEQNDMCVDFRSGSSATSSAFSDVSPKSTGTKIDLPIEASSKRA